MKKNQKKKHHKSKKSGGSKSHHSNHQLSGSIVSLLNETPNERLTFRQIANQLELKDIRSKKKLTEILDQLVFEKAINQVSEHRYQANKKAPPKKKKHHGPQLEGIIDHVNASFAYVMVEGQEKDIWVSSKKLNGAMDGDRVLVTVQPGQRRNRQEGNVVDILERSRTELAGKIDISKNFAFVVPSYRKIYDDIFVAKESINGAKNGQKVIVEIKQWSKKGKSPVGKVVRVLGESGENETEIHSIMFEYGLPFGFPEEIEKAADDLPKKISSKEVSQRRDFRKVTTFTIDPLNAKDFDDALSIQKLENGEWEIGIHIADVTHYVQPDTPIEKEAYERATSVYLVDRTVPMLPEVLSNGLCSLRPNEEKLCFSAVFTLTDQGRVTSEWIGRTVIYSDKRFTYEQAQEVIENQEGEYAEEVLKLNSIAKYLKGRRFRSGAVSFETPEFYFELDDRGKPISVQPKIRKDAHKLVEEFMLLANRKVAEWVYNQRKGAKSKKNTMVYRVHEDPDPERVENFATFAKRFGYEVETETKKLAASINKMIVEAEDKPEQNILQYQAIRAMAKARYTTEPLGHYGLAFKHYTHFTSPIRRYPDMMAHRLIQHYLDAGKPLNPEPLEEACKHASSREKVATDAERASIKFKQVEFMTEYLGKKLTGIVSGATEWGIFVEIDQTKCEGMARLSDIKGDYYSFDEEKQHVIGREHGFTYTIGDPVKVLVKSTNLDRRTIDLDIIN